MSANLPQVPVVKDCEYRVASSGQGAGWRQTMKRQAWVLMAGAALAMASGVPVQAQTKTAWIHVRVEEPRNDSKVSVNLPLTVVQAALALAPEKIVSEGRIHLSGHGHGRGDLSVADLRK